MARKIVYIHPGDMIELRFCSLDYPANAKMFNEEQSNVMKRPTVINFPDRHTLEVFDPYIGVFEGTGEGRRQMLPLVK